MLMNVTADEVVVMEGEEEMYWRVRWSWIQDQGRRNQTETYHVKVREDGVRGEIRWLEVKGEVSCCLSAYCQWRRGELLFYILAFFLCSQMEVLIGNLSSSPYTISVSSKDCPRDLTQTNLLSFPPLPPLSFFFPCAFLPYSPFSSLPSPRCGDMSVVVI